MAARYRSRQGQQRTPLGPGESRANIVNSTPQRPTKTASNPASSPPLPHNKFLGPNGSLDVRSSSPIESPGNQRVSAIKDETKRNSKRDSGISNASSTASGSAPKRKREIGRWQLGKTIGKGGGSTVRLVRHIDSGQIAAVKVISRKMAETIRAQSLANLVDSERSIQDLVAAGKMLPPPPPGLMREIAVMKLLEHPNIVRLYDVWENRNELYLIMEYVPGGELFHYIEQSRGLTEEETVYIFRQIIAALLYCHRLSIHHRDLKPENILLDRENLQVKLVDFGMAALQPQGSMLTTACGSPHYAAPEVIRGRPYDGGKADVWSCGVILYVMLTGTTPYNYTRPEDLKSMYEDISRARYYMPPDLTDEAKDLIQRIFNRDPRQRISMSEIWDHPLLHKFDAEWGFESAEKQRAALLGPSPIDPRFMAAKEEDIDREILRNMRTLWHSVPEKLLVRRLLSEEANQEKYFYAALLKHREEHLENYTGGSDAVSYSPSDYQHTRPDLDTPPMPKGTQKSKSQYSIMNDEHLKPSHSFMEPPPSVSSYDPFRASREPSGVEGSGNYVNVTVHRDGLTVHRRKNSTQHNLRHPNDMRVQLLKQRSHKSTNRSSSTLAQSSTGYRRSVASRKSLSRASLASSEWPSSPPVVESVRPRSGHKRGVSFQHIRRSSTASALTSPDSIHNDHYTPDLQAKARRTMTANDPAAIISSPAAYAANIRSKKEKENTPSSSSCPRVRKQPNTPSHYIRSEIRKVSTELEKACEDAFFRSSVGSSINTSLSLTDKPNPYDTPPSSVSEHTPKAVRQLPSLPVDTPTTFLARTLEETRNKIAARSAAEGADPAKFNEILATLEKIMPPDMRQQDKRAVSAPEAKLSLELNFLPIISEERRSDEDLAATERYRSVTAPVSKREEEKKRDPHVIRVVPASSPVAPRSVRQRTEEPQDQSHDASSAEPTITNSKNLTAPTLADRLMRKKSSDSVAGLKGADVSAKDEHSKKKISWLQKLKGAAPTEEIDEPTLNSLPESWRELDDRVTAPANARPNTHARDKKPQPIKVINVNVDPPTLTTSIEEFPMRPAQAKGLAKWFGKKSNKNPKITATTPAEEPADPFAASSYSTTPPSPLPQPATPTEPTRSWFSRFLRLRPETRLLCFNTSRGRARTELMRLLNSWQAHGLRDIILFPAENIITARVDKNNALGIKPVTFRIELFVVLERGQRVGLSLGRWTQVRGAASSFRQVVDRTQKMMGERGWLVEELEKWNAMCESLG